MEIQDHGQYWSSYSLLILRIAWVPRSSAPQGPILNEQHSSEVSFSEAVERRICAWQTAEILYSGVGSRTTLRGWVRAFAGN